MYVCVESSDSEEDTKQSIEHYLVPNSDSTATTATAATTSSSDDDGDSDSDETSDSDESDEDDSSDDDTVSKVWLEGQLAGRWPLVHRHL